MDDWIIGITIINVLSSLTGLFLLKMMNGVSNEFHKFCQEKIEELKQRSSP